MNKICPKSGMSLVQKNATVCQQGRSIFSGSANVCCDGIIIELSGYFQYMKKDSIYESGKFVNNNHGLTDHNK
jgi:hypothetical protein